MGGSVGFTLREENKKEHRMCRWTNGMPEFFRSLNFINKQYQHYIDYLKIWYEMVQDREMVISGKQETYEHNMTEVYAPYPFLAPMDYGLVVVDYSTNTIISQQNYCGFDLDFFTFVSIYNNSNISDDPEHFVSDKSELYQYKELIENKKVTGLIYFEKNKIDSEKFDRLLNTSIVTWEKIEEILKKYKKDRSSADDYGSFEIDFTPWKLFQYEKTSEQTLKMKQHVIDLGFTLSKEEEALWKEEIDYLIENENNNNTTWADQ